MKKISVLALLTVLAAGPYSFAAGASIAPQIVNGSDATAGNYPSYARLVRADWGISGTYSPYCGAVILDNNYILTAAHCAYIEDNSSEMRMLFTYVYPQLQDESYSSLLSATQVRISNVYIHPDYNDSLLENDIAILKLESSLSLSSSDHAVRPSNENYRLTSDTYIAVGHGDNKTGSDLTDVLQQVELDYVPNASCGYGGSVPDTNLCMKGVSAGSSSINVETFASLDPSTCQGDSGGPLYWTNGSTQTVVGVTSFGPGTQCGDTSYSSTSVFSEVYDFETWISNVTAGSVSATYSFSESDRTSYRSGNYTYKYSANPSSSSGGGSLPLWTTLILGGVALLRRKQK